MYKVLLNEMFRFVPTSILACHNSQEPLLFTLPVCHCVLPFAASLGLPAAEFAIAGDAQAVWDAGTSGLQLQPRSSHDSGSATSLLWTALRLYRGR